MLEVSPLRRAAKQPPCDSAAEALCLIGMFAVPERMAHFDLTQHLVCFPEHTAIWRSMKREASGPPETFWRRVFYDLERERPATAVRQLLGVLDSAYEVAVDDSDDGCTLFMVALKKIERCTEARRELSQIAARAEVLYRVPTDPYTADEKVRMLGLDDVVVGMDIPSDRAC